MTCIDRGLRSQSASSLKRVNYGPEIVDSCMELQLYESDTVTTDGKFLTVNVLFYGHAEKSSST